MVTDERREMQFRIYFFEHVKNTKIQQNTCYHKNTYMKHSTSSVIILLNEHAHILSNYKSISIGFGAFIHIHIDKFSIFGIFLNIVYFPTS